MNKLRLLVILIILQFKTVSYAASVCPTGGIKNALLNLIGRGQSGPTVPRGISERMPIQGTNPNVQEFRQAYFDGKLIGSDASYVSVDYGNGRVPLMIVGQNPNGHLLARPYDFVTGTYMEKPIEISNIDHLRSMQVSKSAKNADIQRIKKDLHFDDDNQYVMVKSKEGPLPAQITKVTEDVNGDKYYYIKFVNNDGEVVEIGVPHESHILSVNPRPKALREQLPPTQVVVSKHIAGEAQNTYVRRSPLGSITAKTDVGARPKNEDAFVITDRGSEIYLTNIDGMGGHAGGRIAAKEIAEKMSEDFQNGRDLVSAFQRAHHRLTRVVNQNPALSDMGAAVAVTKIKKLKDGRAMAETAHLGDVRVMVIRDGKIIHETVDHNLANFNNPGRGNMTTGPMDPGIQITDAERSTLTQALTAQDYYEPTISSAFEVRSGDLIVSLSDGVTDNLSYSEILMAVTNSKDSQHAADVLIDGANNRMVNRGGKKDNATAMIMRVQL